MNSHHGWLVNSGAISIICFAPVAVLLAIAGLIFDAGKKVALLALSLGLLTTLLIFSMGG
jgi:hypothetical protein